MKRVSLIVHILSLLFIGRLGGTNQMEYFCRIEGEHSGSNFGSSMVSLDYNGDGYDDLIALSSSWHPDGIYEPSTSTGKLYYYMGGPDFNNVADYSFNGSFSGHYAGFLRNAGDVNGDGRQDFFCHTGARTLPGDDHLSYSLYIYYGKDIPTDQPDFEMQVPKTGLSGFWVRPLGDINGDSFADLAIEYRYSASTAKGTIINVLLGGSLEEEFFAQTNGLRDYLSFEGVGDVNGDGIGDAVLIGGQQFNWDYSLRFGSVGFPVLDSLLLYENDNGWRSLHNCGVGDVNGDGISDFVLPTEKLWFGSETISPVWDIDLPQGYFSAGNGSPPMIHGDLNGDDYQDIIGGDYHNSGIVAIWLGSANFNGTPDLFLAHPLGYGGFQFGWAKAAGDFDGDGNCDLALSTRFSGGVVGWAGDIFVFKGNAELKDTTVSIDDPLQSPPVDMAWSFDAYPNPLHNNALSISITQKPANKALPGLLSLYNTRGQKVFERKISEGEWVKDSFMASVPELPSGVYFIVLTGRSGHRATKRMIITN